VTDPPEGDGAFRGPASAPAQSADDADSSGVPIEAQIPPTRRLPTGGVVEAAEVAAGHPLETGLRHPDDGRLSHWLRRLDHVLGSAEQAVLFVLLGAVVVTAAAAALSDKLFGHALGRWWFDVVRGGTFSVAMIGAVFASHQRRHLAMDLVSRRLPPRGRLALRIALALFTIFVAALLVRSGLHQLETVGEESGDHVISTRNIVMCLPLGGGLIAVHTLLHMLIDIDYLARGKAPPEPIRSAH
jgi:TRAP-type C4-dicarboxylate transport system permease small subunit